jgi:hypothetical protein
MQVDGADHSNQSNTWINTPVPGGYTRFLTWSFAQGLTNATHTVNGKLEIGKAGSVYVDTFVVIPYNGDMAEMIMRGKYPY